MANSTVSKPDLAAIDRALQNARQLASNIQAQQKSLSSQNTELCALREKRDAQTMATPYTEGELNARLARWTALQHCLDHWGGRDSFYEQLARTEGKAAELRAIIGNRWGMGAFLDDSDPAG